MNRLSAALSLALLMGLVGCVESNTAEERLGAYLSLPQSSELNEQTVREAFLRKIPLGTSAQEVERRLSEAGVGKSKLSSYIGPDANRKAVVRIEFDPTTLGVVKTSYAIPLTFSLDMRLADLKIKIWRTGL